MKFFREKKVSHSASSKLTLPINNVKWLEPCIKSSFFLVRCNSVLMLFARFYFFKRKIITPVHKYWYTFLLYHIFPDDFNPFDLNQTTEKKYTKSSRDSIHVHWMLQSRMIHWVLFDIFQLLLNFMDFSHFFRFIFWNDEKNDEIEKSHKEMWNVISNGSIPAHKH